jgi:hypothetical protein
VEVNLDEAKAARAEALGGESRAIIFGGERFELPPKLPIALMESLAEYLTRTASAKDNLDEDSERAAFEAGGAAQALLQGAEVLLGSDGWRRFKAAGADYSDVLALLTAVIRIYRLGEPREPDGTPEDEMRAATEAVGESPASGSPSSDGGANSRPTGNGSTGGTSDSTSGEATETEEAESLSVGSES